MKTLASLCFLIATLFLVSCKGGSETLPIKFFESTFDTGTEDWTGDAALYTSTQSDSVGFTMSQGKILNYSDTTVRALAVQATNTGDSLFYFIKKKISGLDPNLTYKVAFQINMVTSYPDTTLSSGTLIYIKAGASTEEPTKALSGNYYSVSIAKGAIGKSGTEMLYLGDAGNGIDSTALASIVRDNANLAVEVKPSSAGEIWLCVGTETTYKGKIQLYYDRIYTAVGEKPVE